MAFLSSALGGSILGGVLSVVGRVVDVFAKKKEADIEIARAKALSELKIKEAELDAFKESLSSQDEDYKPEPLPANAPIWAVWLRAIADTLRVLVDSFRVFTRPGLTWALVLALVAFVFTDKLGPVALEALIADFVFTASTAIMWWFGSRPMQRTASVPAKK